MILLIIEDDPNKSRKLREFIVSLGGDHSIAEARSYQSGLKAIITQAPDLIVLDMSMPTYDVSPSEKGGRWRPFAGRDVLAEIKRRRLSSLVVIVTQFESFGEGPEKKTLHQLDAELREEAPRCYLGSVFYHPAETDWRSELRSLLMMHLTGPRT